MSSRSPVLWITVLACGDGTMPITVEGGEITFRASAAEVGPCERVTLEWNAPGARVVNVEDGEVTLTSTFDQIGTVESRPICETTTLVMTAEREEGVTTLTQTVRPIWNEPIIERFTTSMPVTTIDSSVTIDWQVRGAAVISLLQNDEPVSIQELTTDQITSGAPHTGAPFLLIASATTTFTLIAQNPELTVSRELTVTGKPHRIRSFAIRPPAAYATSRVTVLWEAEGIATELYAAGRRITDFPGTLSGSVELEVMPQNLIEVRVSQDLGQGPIYQSFGTLFMVPDSEMEPNDTLPSANYSQSLGLEGALSHPNDVDVAYFPSYWPRSSLRAWTVPRTSTTCSFHPTLTLYDPFGTELGRVSEPPEEEGVCALIDAELHPFAANLVASPFFVSVSSGDGQTGDYLLFFEARGAPPR